MRGDAEADGMDGIVEWHRMEWFGAFVVLAVSLVLLELAFGWGVWDKVVFVRVSGIGLCSLCLLC